MNLKEFLENRAQFASPLYRSICPTCWKAIPTCFCKELKPFVSPISFVIVQHLDEARNPIATARMAHLSISNSKLIMDKNFSENREVQILLADQSVKNFMLYPSPDAIPLELLMAEKSPDTHCYVAEEPINPGKKPMVFWVLDTTWSHTSKMLRVCPSLKSMPRVKFNPVVTSKFQIRKQPHSKCLSTLESIYLVIDRWQKQQNLNFTKHQALLDVFRFMVQQQLDYSVQINNTRHHTCKTARAARRAASSH